MANLVPRRSECSALPKGWIREEVPRASGTISAGKAVEVTYYAPSGRKVRTKPELIKYLPEVDLSAFDFQSGKVNPLLARNKVKKPKSGHYDYTRRTDTSLVPPIRQTASIFKQPVTVHKNLEGKVKSDFKQSTAEKPRQLFWEKRLSGLRASYPEEEYEAFHLPPNFKAVGPGVENDVVLASISTSLHMNNGAISGQPEEKSNLEKISKNPGAFINPNQPLITATIVTEDMVDRQEEIVNETRKKLAEALNALTA